MAIETISAPAHSAIPHGASQPRDNHPSTKSVQESKSLTDALQHQQAQQSKQTEPERKEHMSGAPSMEQVAKEVTDFIQVKYSSLRFEVSEKTDRTVVSVVDKESGEVIRQMPTEDMLKLYERLKELQEEIDQLTGILVDKNA